MTTIKLLALASLTTFAVACGSGSDFKKLKDEACACKTADCATAVNKKLDAEINKLTSEKELENAAADLGAASECLGKLGLKAE